MHNWIQIGYKVVENAIWFFRNGSGTGKRKIRRFQRGHSIATVQDVKSTELMHNMTTIVTESYCASFLLNKKTVAVLA